MPKMMMMAGATTLTFTMTLMDDVTETTRLFYTVYWFQIDSSQMLKRRNCIYLSKIVFQVKICQ